MDHYRSAGPAVELAAALEDLAVVLAGHGHDADARGALAEAVSLYEGMQARWDIRRSWSRLRPYGIKRGARGPRGQRVASGGEALTPTEVKVAALVAQGDSTSDIAQSMSHRTVDAHLYRIFPKLGISSRAALGLG